MQCGGGQTSAQKWIVCVRHAAKVVSVGNLHHDLIKECPPGLPSPKCHSGIMPRDVVSTLTKRASIVLLQEKVSTCTTSSRSLNCDSTRSSKSNVSPSVEVEKTTSSDSKSKV